MPGAPARREAMADWASNRGKATIPSTTHGKPVPGFLAMRYNLADKLVWSKLRARLGLDQASVLLSGSAPLDSEVQEFFLACGMNLLEAYGLTETCPGLTANRPGQIRIGTVGLPLPGVEIKIADDGEILAKGPNITQGYLNRPDATGPAFDAEGWFCTGDLGAVTDEGFVKITGRKKELIKTSGGKYVAPAKIEGKLKSLAVINEAIVIGDRRNFCVALLSIDAEELEEWAKQQGVAADQDSDAVRAAVDAHVAKVNKDLARFESIKYTAFTTEPLTVENGALTASLKVKRSVVEERYADLIDGMYTNNKK